MRRAAAPDEGSRAGGEQPGRRRGTAAAHSRGHTHSLTHAACCSGRRTRMWRKEQLAACCSLLQHKVEFLHRSSDHGGLRGAAGPLLLPTVSIRSLRWGGGGGLPYERGPRGWTKPKKLGHVLEQRSTGGRLLHLVCPPPAAIAAVSTSHRSGGSDASPCPMHGFAADLHELTHDVDQGIN